MIPLVAFVEGAGPRCSRAAQAGALRAVVPTQQLPAAVAVVTGREAAVSARRPAARRRALRRRARAAVPRPRRVVRRSRRVRCSSMRTPFQEERERDRVTAAHAARRGLPLPLEPPVPADVRLPLRARELHRPGRAARDRRHREGRGADGRRGRPARLGVRRVPAARRVPVAVRPPAAPRARQSCCSSSGRGRAARSSSSGRTSTCSTASILPTALAIPSTDSVVRSYQLAMTPDRLLGRVESVRSTIALLIAPLGPLVAGLAARRRLGARDDRRLRRRSASSSRSGGR